MAINEKATATVDVDGTMAENELKELRSRAKDLKKELDQLKLAKDPGYALKKREFEDLNKQITQAKKSTFDFNAVLKNLSGSSMKELSRAQSVLNSQLRNNKRDTASARLEFEKTKKQLQLVRGEISRVNTEVKGLNQNMSLGSRITSTFNKGMGLMIGIAASAGAAIAGIVNLVKAYSDFEEKLANLSALTGLQGSELEWLSQRARETSVAVTEQGISFKNSASEIVDAYTMVGSKRPELLANREALAMVTEQAMILSRAAKIELAPAAEALTTTMNQFNESADQSSRIINAIAAGSKAGAGNVEYINAAMEKAGTAAKGAGIGVEQMIGIIEGVAPKFAEPAEAGTMLRNVFIKMQNLDDELNPAIVGFDKALENLTNRQLSTTEITKIFGVESFNMINTLIEGREDIARFTDVVTGSSVALQQAAINSNTAAARLELARNKVNLLKIEMGEGLKPVLLAGTNAFYGLMAVMNHIITNGTTYARIVGGIVVLMLAYRARMIEATMAQIGQNIQLKAGIALKIRDAVVLQALMIKEAALAGWRVKGTIATKAATAAQRVFNLVVSQFPGFAIVAAIGAIVGAIKLWDKYNAAAIERQELQNSLLDENKILLEKATKATADAAASQQNLNLLQQSQKRALQELNQEKLKQMEIDLQQMRINQTQAAQSAGQLTMWQTVMVAVRNGFEGAAGAAVAGSQLIIDNMSDIHDKYSDVINDMQSTINQLKGFNTEIDSILTAESRANAIAGNTVSQLEEKINLYTLALRHAVIGSEDYNRITLLLAENQTKLNSVIQNNTGEQLDALEQTTNAYDKLKKELADMESQLRHFVALGDESQAKSALVVIQRLQGEIEDLNDTIEKLKAELSRPEKMPDRPSTPGGNSINDAHQNALNREREIMDLKMANHEKEVELKLKMAELEKQMHAQALNLLDQAGQEAIQVAMNLISQYNQANFDEKMAQLDLWRESELKKEGLTEKEKLKIQEKYDKQRAELQTEAWKKQRNADLVQAGINTAIAITRVLAGPVPFPANIPLLAATAALGAVQIAGIAAQPVPQFFSGRYPVRGDQDGRLYNAQYVGEPRTGIYTTPSLIADHGPELIIDAPTTRNLQVNHPEIISGIMAARVPQYYSGRMPESGSVGVGGSTSSIDGGKLENVLGILIESTHENTQAIRKMQGLLGSLQGGIKASVSLFDIDKISDDRDNIEQLTSF